MLRRARVNNRHRAGHGEHARVAGIHD
jgi:hypothetical protein